MTLKTLFAIPITVILVVTMSLAGMLAGQVWSGQERGKIAVEAVARMRLLVDLQADLRRERIVTNLALGKPFPMPEAIRQQVSDARQETDRGIEEVAAGMRAAAQGHMEEPPPEPWLASVAARLSAVRAETDAILVGGQATRSFSEISSATSGLLAVSELLENPFERASLAVTAADPRLSGLVTEDRLAVSLRGKIGLIVAMVMPRINAGEPLTAGETRRLGDLLAQASVLNTMLENTIEIAGATEAIRRSLASLRAINVNELFNRLREQGVPEALNPPEGATPFPSHGLLITWGERISDLRSAVGAAMVDRVVAAEAENERQFDAILAASGVILVAMLESLVLLSQRVVRPLAQLGLAITRIAAGDRSVPMTLQSGTREIAEMVTAVETLRQAALVADAAAMRRRVAARQRMLALREALGIVQTVREPALELERGVARLSEGIDATIALVSTATAAPPPTLGVAANAIRVGLAAMRESAADFDATFKAAGFAQEEDRPEAELVAHIQAIRALVDRRDQAVRGFVHPSLVALRDATAATGRAPTPALRDLVSHQFECIEETVGMVASMLAAVTEASAMIRDLPLEDTPMAA